MKKTKEELDAKKKRRLQIQEMLKEVPEGERIYIPKKELEELLFDELIYDEALQAPLKVPAWSGEFLSKIDLSEISFENVSWAIKSAYEWQCYIFEEFEICETLDSVSQELINQYLKKYEQSKNNRTRVIYSKTNANIDFKSSYEYKKFGEIAIFNCDFSGTDLSKNDMSASLHIRESDLSKTKIKFIPLKEYKAKSKEDRKYDEVTKKSKGCYIWILDTNLEESDLSLFEVDFVSEINMGFYSCNLKNTGIRINNLNKEAIKESGHIYYYDITVDGISKKFKDGEYEGCYINGTLVQSNDERKKTAKEIKDEYLQLKSELTDSLLLSIQRQIEEMKKTK